VRAEGIEGSLSLDGGRVAVADVYRAAERLQAFSGLAQPRLRDGACAQSTTARPKTSFGWRVTRSM
jgi:hypothetical protein